MIFLIILQNFLVPADAQGGGAVGGENDVGMLQAIQESIRDLIRDIGVTNLVEGQFQQPPENDDDENNNEFD